MPTQQVPTLKPDRETKKDENKKYKQLYREWYEPEASD